MPWARNDLATGQLAGHAVGGLRSLNFRVLRNDGRLLVLHLGGDACGAYCEPIDQQRLFDAQTALLLRQAAAAT